ncbi:MAG: sensor histidine kinase [Ilumatobacter sp.]
MTTTHQADHVDPGDFDPGLEAVESYHAQLVLDQKSAWPAAIIIAILSLIFTTWWGLALAAVIAAMTLVRMQAFGPLARNDLYGAVKWVTTGTWGVAIGVVSIIPDAFPIMVINLISPLLVAAINLNESQLRRMMTAGVVVGLVLGVLGFRSEGTGLDEAAPEWFVQFVMIAYLAAHVILVGTLVRESNRVRLLGINRVHAAHDELRRSRARVVTAADGERERIERNIHDGAQQRLVSLAVQLRLASQLSDQGQTITSATLDSLHDETREAIDELRELAHGIYPAVLTERGIIEAIRHLARTAPNEVEVICGDTSIADLDFDHAATYFVCAEALQNVAKHCAPTTHVSIEITSDEHTVTATISDTGSGFDPSATTHSRGLLNMADRAGAAGGSVAIASASIGGTSVVLTVPTPPVSE